MKIIYLLLDAISYEDSWLSTQENMPKLREITQETLNFHNHYSVTHNTRGNLASMLFGASSSITKVMGRKQSFRNSDLISIQEKIRKFGFTSNYFGTQPLFHSERVGDNLDFDNCVYLSPSMSDFYISAEKFNVVVKEKLSQLTEKNFSIFHYTDVHEPYETPYNVLTRKEYPNIYNFHYRLSNLLFRIPRKIYNNFFCYKNYLRKKQVFSKYPNLEYLCDNPFGAVNSPERYSYFYEKIWSNKLYVNEYIGMMKKALNYIDEKIYEILMFIKENHKKNTLIIISSDHGNNGVISPNELSTSGRLSKKATHIPLSIISFDEKIKKKFIDNYNNFNFTTHTNLYETLLYLASKSEEDYSMSLFNKKEINSFIISELNDLRFKFGECILRRPNKEITIRIPPSDNLNNMSLIEKNIIINEISDLDYDTYRKFKSSYNYAKLNRI